jgi:hypothetical protein
MNEVNNESIRPLLLIGQFLIVGEIVVRILHGNVGPLDAIGCWAIN